MTPPLISICVPVYNVAPYFERCVRSLMEQTYMNLEYVFVDDCSTDASMAVLEKVMADYPLRSKHVTIVTNDRNHGLAYTRRVSIEKACGEYVICVDSDDYVEKNMVECLLDKAIETDAEMTISGYYIESATIAQQSPHPCTDKEDYIQLALLGQLTPVWNKLIRRSLFTEGRSCYAPEGLDCGEDRLMTLHIAAKAKHIVTIDKPLYHYIQRRSSISQNKSEKNFYCSVVFWGEAEKLLAEMGLTEKYRQLVRTQKIEDKAQLLMFCDNQTRRKYGDLYAEEERLYTPNLTRGIALMHWLTKHHLWFLAYCYQCYIRWLNDRKWKQ